MKHLKENQVLIGCALVAAVIIAGVIAAEAVGDSVGALALDLSTAIRAYMG